MAVPQALWLPGVSGDYASVPDNAALDITGDITLTADVGVNEIPPSGLIVFLSKWTESGDQRSYYLGANVADGEMVLELGWSTNGAAETIVQSTVAIPVEAGTFERIKVEAFLDVDPGTVDFFYYDENDVQQQLGGQVSLGGTTSVFSSSAAINIGATEGGTANLWQGRVYGVVIDDGTVQLDVDFTTQDLEDTSFTEDSANGFTVTVNQAGSAPNTAEIREVTHYYGWRVPTQGSSEDIWGEPLNEAYGAAADDLFESIDTIIGLLETEIDTLDAQVDSVSERTEAIEALFNRPRYARVYRASTNFVLPWNTTTLVEWDTESLDRNGWFTLDASTRLTKSVIDPDAPDDGLHLVRAVLRLPTWIEGVLGADDSYKYTVRLLKNGSAIASASVPGMNEGHRKTDPVETQTVIVQTLAAVTLDDYFEVNVLATEGPTASNDTDSYVVAGAFASYFEIARLPSKATELIPTGLLAGLLWWFEARLDNEVDGVADETNITTLTDWSPSERDAPADVGSVAELDVDSDASFNGQPVFRAGQSDGGQYSLDAIPKLENLSILFLVLPSIAASSQIAFFSYHASLSPSGTVIVDIFNDSVGGDNADIEFRVDNGPNNTVLSSNDGRVYDGDAHAVLCTYDGTTMRTYIDDMTAPVNSAAHSGGGDLAGTPNRGSIMHRAGADEVEGEWTLHAAWDHHLDDDERDTLAAFLLDKYAIS